MYDQSLWEGVLSTIEKSVDEKLVNTWLRPAKISANRGDGIVIFVPNKFYKNWLEKNYLTQIKSILQDDYGIDAPVEISTQEVSNISPARETPQPKVKNNISPMDAAFIFDNFVSGDSNSFAYNAALAVAEGNFNIYNPLFIYGGTGLGKTHLMYAIANKVRERFPKMNILYMDSETFSTEILNMFNKGARDERQDRIEKMKERFNNVDLFMLDDIQFLKTRPKTLEFFFNIFNDLHLRQKQIVLSSDESPQEIDMAERMRSRFSGGFQAEILPPSMEERVAILMQKSDELGFVIDDVLSIWLAENVSTKNVRELIGALKRVHLYASVHNSPMSPVIAEKALKDSGQMKKASIVVSPQQLITVVSETYSVKLSDLVSKKRTQSIVVPRQVAMYLMKERLNMSLKEIGTHFGGRDHSTVKYAVDSIKKQLETDEFLKDITAKIIKKTFS